MRVIYANSCAVSAGFSKLFNDVGCVMLLKHRPLIIGPYQL